MESVNSIALRNNKKYLTWLHRQKKLQISQSSSSLHTLINDIVLLVVKNYIPFIYFIAYRVFRFNLKRRKRVIDSDFSKRLNLFWIIGIFFMSFFCDYLYSHKKVTIFFNSEHMKIYMDIPYNIPFSRFSYSNLIFLEGRINCSEIPVKKT